MRSMKLMLALTLVPALLAAQQNLPQQSPVDRLREVLPADVADQVAGTVNDAIARGLPGQAIAERALEAIAKGRSGAEVSAAARAFAADLSGGRDALQRGGRRPDASEMEAAATAMSLGVDGSAISALASSAPSGRSLAVPLAVIGALVDRGLPSDGALKAVQDRLAARAGNEELVEMPGEARRLLGEGQRPADVGRALGEARAAAGAPMGPPAGVVPVPAGPPAAVPANPGQPAQRPQPAGQPPAGQQPTGQPQQPPAGRP
ncbi:MAG: hypothetical protein HY560_04695 [Gemmatimonadetes bacterium]|nr:hypothetical protein [Gemmatimonadota bacterium]